MTTTPKNKLRMAVLAAAVLALAAMTPLVEAKEERGPRADHRGPGDRQMADDHRGPGKGNATVRDRMAAEYHKHCDEPANETAAKRCEKMAEKMDKEHKARRHAHALLHAIAAHERILGRIEYKINKTEARLAEGNLTGNQTESLEKRLEKLEGMKERQIEKIDGLQAKLEELKAKWEAARERAAEAKDKDKEHEDEESDDDATSTSTSSSPPAGNSTADP